eukprot:m.255013 g.255013  ORF g.255013 m.255013 type:complete len:343 (+) comp33925_c1_seq2:98-1126(+)
MSRFNSMPTRAQVMSGSINLFGERLRWKDTWHDCEESTPTFALCQRQCDECRTAIKQYTMMSVGTRMFCPDAPCPIQGKDYVHLKCIEGSQSQWLDHELPNTKKTIQARVTKSRSNLLVLAALCRGGRAERKPNVIEDATQSQAVKVVEFLGSLDDYHPALRLILKYYAYVTVGQLPEDSFNLSHSVIEVAGFSGLPTATKVEYLRRYGENADLAEKKLLFSDMTFLLLGGMNKHKVNSVINSNGGAVKDNLVRDHTHCILGKKITTQYGQTSGPGSKKCKDARKRGLQFWSEEELMDAVEKRRLPPPPPPKPKAAPKPKKEKKAADEAPLETRKSKRLRKT